MHYTITVLDIDNVLVPKFPKIQKITTVDQLLCSVQTELLLPANDDHHTPPTHLPTRLVLLPLLLYKLGQQNNTDAVSAITLIHLMEL